jgi:hypothetical protein
MVGPSRWEHRGGGHVRQRQLTFDSVAEQRQRVAFLERNGCHVAFKREGHIVLHRVDSGGVPQARGRQDECRCRDDEHAAAAAVAGL